MKNLLEVVLALVFIAIPLGVLSYVVANSINDWFGEKIFVIFIFTLGLFFLVLEIAKKIEKTK